MMDKKYCPKCKRDRSASEFYKNRSRSDGLDCYCKDCVRKYRSNPYMRAIAVRATTRYHQTAKGQKVHRRANEKYRRSEKGRENKLKNTKQYQENNPQKTRAHRAVNDAIRGGKLPSIHTQICTICGSQAEHYHHGDYSRKNRLNVTSPCQRCHQKIHRRESG